MDTFGTLNLHIIYYIIYNIIYYKYILQGSVCSATGQGRLVMRERFTQFKELVDNCELDRGEKPTTVTDLMGFWEMIYVQVREGWCSQVKQLFKVNQVKLSSNRSYILLVKCEIINYWLYFQNEIFFPHLSLVKKT